MARSLRYYGPFYARLFGSFRNAARIRRNLSYLRANVAPWPSITVSPEAIGQPGRRSMTAVGSRSVDHQLGTETHGDATVDVISLGEAIRRAGKVDLLKMDIEGSEAEAFADPVPELSAVRCAAIEWHEHIRSGVLQLLKDRLSPTHHIVRIVEDDPRYGMLYAVRADHGL